MHNKCVRNTNLFRKEETEPISLYMSAKYLKVQVNKQHACALFSQKLESSSVDGNTLIEVFLHFFKGFSRGSNGITAVYLHC